MRRFRDRAWPITAAALLGLTMPMDARGQEAPGQAAASEAGSLGRAESDAGRDDSPPTLPHCEKPIATIALNDPDDRWWVALKLENPRLLLKRFIQESGCFLLLDRGQGMQAAAWERATGDKGALLAGLNMGRDQMRAADYMLTPDLLSPQRNTGGIGGIVAGVSSNAAAGSILGGMAAGRRADVSLSMVDMRTTEEITLVEGRARRADVTSGASAPWRLANGAVGGGYDSSDAGRIVTLAYLKAYKDLVEQTRNATPAGDSFVPGASDSPFLPWPPPSPSGMGDITRAVRPSATLGDLAGQIRTRLEARGYDKLHHFAVPGGFGITTEVERIEEDGRPAANRWQLGKLPARRGLLQYISDLFSGAEGRFRLYAILVTDQDPAPANYKAEQMDIDRWKTSGRLYLSRQMSAASVRRGTRVWLLVYEFRQNKSKGGKLVAPDQEGLPFARHRAFLGIR